MGLVLAALSGAGNALANSAGEYQKFNDQQAILDKQRANEIDLAKVRSDLSVEAQNRIAEANLARENAPLTRFQNIVSSYIDKYKSDPSLLPVAAPAATPVQSDGVDATPPETDTSGDWNSINQSYAEGEPARNAVRLDTLNKELAAETDPENIAALKREIARLPADTSSPQVSAAPATVAPAQVAAKLSDAAIRDAAFQAAMEDARVTDPLAYKAAAAAFKGEHILVGQGGAIVDPVTGKVKYHNDTAEKIAAQRSETALEIASKRAQTALDVADKKANAQATRDQIKANAALQKTLSPAEMQSMAQLIADNKLPAPTGTALRNPQTIAIMKLVTDINPNYDSKDYKTMLRSEGAFATGPEAKAVRSFNVGISHLGTLEGLINALDNRDIQAINKFGNMVASQTGQKAPTEFNAAKKIVSDEIVKAIVGTGGGVADREEAAKTIDASNSPAQLRGVIQTYKELMKGQLEGLAEQYARTTGKNDFEERFLTSAAKAVAHSRPGNEFVPPKQVTTVPNPLVTQPANRPSLDSIFGK